MFKHSKPVFICYPKRTAIGSMGGGLSSVPAPVLGAKVIESIFNEHVALKEKVQEVIMGCVLQAGLGQAPARQATINSGLPLHVQAQTINKVCSSGLKAVMLAANSIELEQANAIIAGGMENMSLSPYYLPSLRNGARLGNAVAEDAIVKDGLWDVYNNQHMGLCAELCAKEYTLSREAQDKFALNSYEKANKAISSGKFKNEIVNIEVNVGKSTLTFSDDEEPGRLKADKVPQLKPVFQKDGTVTAANASSINDGAAAMLICSENFVKETGVTPIARIVAQSWNAQAPEWFTTAPVGAIRRVCEAAGVELGKVDLFEINEAFSAVALAIGKDLSLPEEKLNVHGGAVALGHPIGASGARILTTLIHALKTYNLKTGIASLCNGGGEATAVLVETV